MPDAEEKGPWVLDVVLKGPEDGGYYMPMRVRIQFPAAYPSEPPKVSIKTVRVRLVQHLAAAGFGIGPARVHRVATRTVE